MPKRDPRYTHKTFRLSYELDARVRDACARMGIQYSEFVRRALLFYLEFLEEEEERGGGGPFVKFTLPKPL